MPLYSINQGTSGGSWDLMQAIQALSGSNDVGAIKSFAPITPPAAPTVAVLAQSGNLTGNYQYVVAFVTGYVQGQSVAQGGTLYTQGNTGSGTASTTVSPSAQQVSLSNIPIGPTGTVARILGRTQANGSTFYVLAQINDNQTTTYTDNTADANLGSAMQTSNTTGSWFQGKFIGTDQNAPFQWPVLTTLPAVGPAGTVILYKAPSGVISLYGSDGSKWNQISGGGTTADYYQFTAAAGQTTITLPNGKTYSPGTNTMQLYIAGDRQDPGTFTETSSSQITVSTAFTGGEDVMLYWFLQQPSGQTVPVATSTTLGGIKGSSTIGIAADGTATVTTGAANGVASLDGTGNVPLSQLGNISGQENVASYTASAGQTVFTLPSGQTYTPGQHAMNVYIRGAFQDPNSAFTETNNTTVTLSSALVGGEDVVLRWYKTTPAAITALPIATATSAGAVKGSKSLVIAADGTANVDNAGRVAFGSVDGSNNLWFGTGLATEPNNLAFGWKTDGTGKVTQITLGASSKPSVLTGNNTVDDGSGAATFVGNLTTNGEFLYLPSTGTASSANAAQARFGLVDRAAGSITLQLGNNGGTQQTFEILDSAWTKVLFEVDNTSAVKTTYNTLDDGSGNMIVGGTLTVGGKPAGGPLASAKEVEVTGTAAQNILSYTPTAADNYTVKVYFRVVTAATTVTLAVTYTDVTGAQTTTLVNATSMSTGSYSETPLFINSVANQPITVTVTAGTANQVYVSASITEG